MKLCEAGKLNSTNMTFIEKNVRHGRHHSQGIGRRGRRSQASRRVFGGRRHGDRLAPSHRRWLRAQGPGDRPCRGRRRRGSLIAFDAGGALTVGPESAGPSPGPACYDQGSTIPTVTGANLILGYINPRHLVGGAVRLDAEKARRVFAERIARPLGMSMDRAAYGAHQIAASNMIRAIKALSTERGRDAREFALFAFGSNGPLFACGMAAALGLRRVVVPPAPGLFSSFGLLYADVEHHCARTFRRLLCRADLAEIQRAWEALAAQARKQLAVEGFVGPGTRLRRSAALYYQGQSFKLTVPLTDGSIDAAMVQHLKEAFDAEHKRTYGHRAGLEEPVELVAIQLVGKGLREETGVPERVRSSRKESGPVPPRSAYFGSEIGWVETPALRRSDLAEAIRGRRSSRSTTRPASSRQVPRRASTTAITSTSTWPKLCR